jgi:hypothetical protein
MFLFLYFGILVLATAVMMGVMSWPWAVLLGVALLVVDRKLIAASHITDGDEASDEHGRFRQGDEQTHGH